MNTLTVNTAGKIAAKRTSVSLRLIIHNKTKLPISYARFLSKTNRILILFIT